MCYRSSFLVKGSTSALERCEGHTRSPQRHKGSPYSPVSSPRRLELTSPLRCALEGGTDPCTRCRGLHTPKAPHAPRSFTTNAQAPRMSNHQLNRLGFQEPKSNKHSSFYSNESSPRTQIDAPNAMARTQEVLKSFSPKFHQSNTSYGGI